MSQSRDEWDADEREALDGLADDLAEIRRRHAGDPSLAMLRAADEDALPPELQARVARHLAASAWSRALVDGLRETDAGVDLDRETEQRLFDRITAETRAAAPRRTGRALVVGGLALAATLLIGVFVSRPGRPIPPAPIVDSPSGGPAPVAKPEPVIAVTKPEVKLSPALLTWRGAASANPALKDLRPAFDFYRASDYPQAVAAFDQLSALYPKTIEVRFYQGVSHLLAGDPAGAVAPLDAAAALRDVTFMDDVLWYRAVAQQRSGKPEAREGFTALCRGKSAHAIDACAALDHLGASPSPR